MNGPGSRSAHHVRSVMATGAVGGSPVPSADRPSTRDGDANLGRGRMRLPGSSMPAERAVPMARIYQPAPSPMQSAPFGTRDWVLEFAPGSPRDTEPLMGWTAGEDPFASITRLRFPDLQSAIAFAERQGWRYLVREPPARRLKPKSYADNFRYDLTSALTRAQQAWDGRMSPAGGISSVERIRQPGA